MNSSHIRKFLRTTTLAPIWAKLTEQDIDLLFQGRSISRRNGSSYSKQKILLVFLKNFNKLSESFHKKFDPFVKLKFKKLLTDDFDVSDDTKKYHVKIMKTILKSPHINSLFPLRAKLLFAKKLDQLKNSPNTYTQLVLQNAGSKKNDLLFTACRKGNRQIVKILIKNGVEINQRQNKVGKSPIEYCCKYNRLRTAKLLIEFGARFDKLLPFAIYRWNFEFAKHLIQKGAKVGEPHFNEMTLLLWSCFSGDTETVKRLVEKGNSVDASDQYSRSLLQLSSQYGHLEIVKYLLFNGANIDSFDSSNNSSLISASLNGHLDVVRFLIDNGANVDISNNFKISPLHVACKNGDFEIAKLLIKAGANIDARDSDSAAPLLYAVIYNHYDIAEFLLANNAHVDACDNRNETSLHWACSENNLKIAKLLIENGANVNACDNYGHPPIAYTTDLILYQLLKENGADFFRTTEVGLC